MCGRKACLSGWNAYGPEEPITGQPLLQPVENLGVGHSSSKPVGDR